MSDPIKPMTEREKLAACEALDKCENSDIARMMIELVDYNPFEKHKLLLPSEIRKRSIMLLKNMIMKGKLVGQKL